MAQLSKEQIQNIIAQSAVKLSGMAVDQVLKDKYHEDLSASLNMQKQDVSIEWDTASHGSFQVTVGKDHFSANYVYRF